MQGLATLRLRCEISPQTGRESCSAPLQSKPADRQWAVQQRCSLARASRHLQKEATLQSAESPVDSSCTPIAILFTLCGAGFYLMKIDLAPSAFDVALFWYLRLLGQCLAVMAAVWLTLLLAWMAWWLARVLKHTMANAGL